MLAEPRLLVPTPSRAPPHHPAEAAQRASNAWIAGRSALLGAVKPGVDAILLQFSSQDGRQVCAAPPLGCRTGLPVAGRRWLLAFELTGLLVVLLHPFTTTLCRAPTLSTPPRPTQVVRFPWYARFAHWVEPLLAQVLGPADAGNVVRLQLARMAPGARILPHTDTGGYAAAGHRIHVVLQTNPGGWVVGGW